MEKSVSCLPLVAMLLLVTAQPVSSVGKALIEPERVLEYHKRNYTFPFETYVPNTTGWRNLMAYRLGQIQEIPSAGRRYESYYQTMHSAMLTPNFTEYGFGLAKCPTDLLAALQQGIRDGLPTAGLEERDEVIPGPNPPWLVSRPDLTDRVLRELQHYSEEWAGFPLVAHQAYGFRIYRNESKLYMHSDRISTHVISFILHIDSSDDAEPWPIFIEDFLGRTHEVILTPGDILFYESSKCLHGRPRAFRGSWYTSVFVHYYPKIGGWSETDHDLEAHYVIPPIWANDPDESKPLQHRRLVMVETSMKEPDCPDEWCATLDSIKWGGPAQEGFLLTPALEQIPFHPKSPLLDRTDEL